MNAREHFEQDERLLSQSELPDYPTGIDRRMIQAVWAQAHFAAAAALSAADRGQPGRHVAQSEQLVDSFQITREVAHSNG